MYRQGGKDCNTKIFQLYTAQKERTVTLKSSHYIPPRRKGLWHWNLLIIGRLQSVPLTSYYLMPVRKSVALKASHFMLPRRKTVTLKSHLYTTHTKNSALPLGSYHPYKIVWHEIFSSAHTKECGTKISLHTSQEKVCGTYASHKIPLRGRSVQLVCTYQRQQPVLSLDIIYRIHKIVSNLFSTSS